MWHDKLLGYHPEELCNPGTRSNQVLGGRTRGFSSRNNDERSTKTETGYQDTVHSRNIAIILLRRSRGLQHTGCPQGQGVLSLLMSCFVQYHVTLDYDITMNKYRWVSARKTYLRLFALTHRYVTWLPLLTTSDDILLTLNTFITP